MEIVAAIPGNEDIALSTPVDEYPCNRGFTRSYHRPEAAVEAGAEFRGRLLVDSAPRVVALIMHGAPAVVPPLPPPALLSNARLAQAGLLAKFGVKVRKGAQQRHTGRLGGSSG